MSTIWTYVTQDVQTVLESGSIAEVIQLMTRGVFRHVPVVNEVGSLVGIISDRDVKRLMPPPGTESQKIDDFMTRTVVGDVMTRDPVTIQRDGTLLEAVQLTLQHTIGALPVMEGDNLIGILSQTDILKAFANRLELEDPPFTGEGHSGSMDLLHSIENTHPSVLVVEPNEILRKDLVRVLEATNFEVISFEQLSELPSANLPGSPDLILMSVLAKAKDDPLEVLHSMFPLTPVVVTREGRSPQATNRKGRGPLFLPCSPETLIKRIRADVNLSRWVAERPNLLASPIAPKTGTIDIHVSVPRQVLVVDQDPLSRKVLSHFFRQAGCEVTEAVDGHEALSRLALEVFDIVTMELDLPYRSGFELLEFVQRSAEPTPRIAVVSGARRDEDLVQAYSLGAIDYIRKPLHQETVNQQLSQLVMDEPEA